MSSFDFTAMQESLQEIEDTPGGSSSTDITPNVADEEAAVAVPNVEAEMAEETVVAVPNVENRDNECCVCMTRAADTYFTCSHTVCGRCYQRIMDDAVATSFAATCPLCRKEQFRHQPPAAPLRFPEIPLTLLYPGWNTPGTGRPGIGQAEAAAEMRNIER